MTYRSVKNQPFIMPRTSEQYEEIRKSKKKLIMDAALELFGADGYHQTPISKIAEKANISKGLMYNYFKSKEELLLGVIDSGLEEITLSFDLNKDTILSDDEFEYYITHIFVILDTQRSFWRLYFSLMLQPAIYKIIEEKVIEWYTPLIQILKKFFERKNIENPEMEAILLGSMLDGISFNYILNPNLFPIEKVKKHIIAKLKHEQ